MRGAIDFFTLALPFFTHLIDWPGLAWRNARSDWHVHTFDICHTFYTFVSHMFLTFSNLFTIDPLFRTVSRGSPGPQGSVLRKFSESSWKEKVGGGGRRLEKVGES
jgi:hypothetical protein